MTKKIGIVGSMINTSDYLLFKDLGERYILKRYDSIEQANNDDCDCIIVTDGDKDCRDNGACVLIIKREFPCLQAGDDSAFVHTFFWLSMYFLTISSDICPTDSTK